jgi:hypothetical protein
VLAYDRLLAKIFLSLVPSVATDSRGRPRGCAPSGRLGGRGLKNLSVDVVDRRGPSVGVIGGMCWATGSTSLGSSITAAYQQNST